MSPSKDLDDACRNYMIARRTNVKNEQNKTNKEKKTVQRKQETKNTWVKTGREE